ncbi:MAG: hypothetical protein KDJ54_07130 [Candidatus Competibacteraceae bacterium]|nr:hypothetical protein [Candidatus Competibacteraceae bacterium]
MNEAQRNRRLLVIKQAASSARRRSELATWQERYDHLQSIRPRSEAEHQAQAQALALLEQSRPR